MYSYPYLPPCVRFPVSQALCAPCPWQDVLRPTRKKGPSLTMADVMSPHGTATGLCDKEAEQTRLCDQCGRWDHLSYVRKLGGLSICRWCKPVDPSDEIVEVKVDGYSEQVEEEYYGGPEVYIGCVVERHFPGYGLYQGTVIDYDHELDMFKVQLCLPRVWPW